MKRPTVIPGLLVGIGLGGFIDGIVFHQLLQWHHMVSATGCCPTTSLAGLEQNTTADGAFHAVMWAVTLAGVVAIGHAWLERKSAPPWRAQLGAMLGGWGIFNFVDSGNHFILGLHHVRDDLGGPVGWDIGFLGLALAQIALGWLVVRTARDSAASAGTH